MDSESSSTEEEILQETSVEPLSETEKHALKNFNHENLNRSEYIRLRLEFKEIVKMDFLHDYTSLVRLDLNNNLIEKIWGLERLANLTWLNLSSNRIENIEGLDSLWKLELLNLSYNRISLLKNMDALEKLTHFFVSQNLIGQLESVLYLRKFKSLFKLSVAGNPFAQKGNYSFYIAAFLPNITLLDNILIGPKMREEASVKYKLELKKLKHQEMQNQKAKLNEDASGSFYSNLKDDAEATRPESLPDVASEPQTVESQTIQLCSQIFAVDLEEHSQMKTELGSFFNGQMETEAFYQQRASQILADFEEQHTQRKIEIKKLQDPEVVKIKINDCQEEISRLCKSLLTLEFELVRNLDDNIKLLDSSISELLNTGDDSARQDDLQETMDDTETQWVTKCQDSGAAIIKEMQEREEKRNRVRISDIQRYAVYLKTQLEKLQ